MGAGIAMGLGAIGPGVGEGFRGGQGLRGHWPQPQGSGPVDPHHAGGPGVSESTGIYSLVVALLLIFVV